MFSKIRWIVEYFIPLNTCVYAILMFLLAYKRNKRRKISTGIFCLPIEIGILCFCMCARFGWSVSSLRGCKPNRMLCNVKHRQLDDTMRTNAVLIQLYTVMWCVLKYGIESVFHIRFQIVVILIETLFLFLSFLLFPLHLRIAAHFSFFK